MNNKKIKINWESNNIQRVLEREMNKLASDLDSVAKSNQNRHIERKIKSILDEKEILG